jgi:hypothetical protein
MYLHGCNYPWSTDGTVIYYGLDFGANVWGSHLGVTSRRAAIARDFAGMAALGVAVVRWFVFCDGRSGIVYDEIGLPVGIDDHFFADMDAALEIARGVGIRLVLVLLDHRWMFDGVRETIADPVSGLVLQARLPDGRARVLLDERGHDAIFAHVIVPVLQRYGPAGARADLADQVVAWELMNEPDWIIEEWERDLSRHVARPLPFATVAALIGRFSETVHAHTTALATIGGARARNLWAWDDDALGLDLLQVHQYPDTRRPDRDEDLFGMRMEDLGVRRGVILGEFPGNGPAQHPPGVVPPPLTATDYLEFAVSAGYAGAWPWSFSGTDDYGRIPPEFLADFARAYPHLANPRFQP